MSPSSLRKYRYDEVSLSSNFSKPVATPEPVTKSEDIFAGFSFSSPLKEFSAFENKREDPYEQIELTRNNIIPQPAPRRSLTQEPQEHIYSDVSDSDTVTLNDSDTVTSDMVTKVEEEARVVKQLGARPKNTMTMDIRTSVVTNYSNDYLVFIFGRYLVFDTFSKPD